jgi:hypothetical protein
MDTRPLLHPGDQAFLDPVGLPASPAGGSPDFSPPSPLLPYALTPARGDPEVAVEAETLQRISKRCGRDRDVAVKLKTLR